MAGTTRADAELLQNPQVHIVVPGIQLAKSVGDLPTMRAQVSVLRDEGVEGGPLLLWSEGRRTRWRSASIERDLGLAARDVDEVVPALAIAIRSSTPAT